MDELPEDLPPLEDMSHVLQATTPYIYIYIYI